MTPAVSVPGRAVRPARADDLTACGALCERIHGHDRNLELADAIEAQTACVVESPERITGYATGFGYGWHAVAEGNEDLVTLLGSAAEFMGLGVLIPSRNAELLGWLLGRGLRLVQQSTLMTLGLYSEPAGASLASSSGSGWPLAAPYRINRPVGRSARNPSSNVALPTPSYTAAAPSPPVISRTRSANPS